MFTMKFVESIPKYFLNVYLSCKYSYIHYFYDLNKIILKCCIVTYRKEVN